MKTQDNCKQMMRKMRSVGYKRRKVDKGRFITKTIVSNAVEEYLANGGVITKIDKNDVREADVRKQAPFGGDVDLFLRDYNS